MPTAPAALRGVTQDNGRALAELRVAAMRESLESVGRFDPDRAQARFLDGFDPRNTREIVSEGTRIGFVVVRQAEGHLMLDHLYIAPGSQGLGYGSQILKAIFAEADRENKVLRVGALKGSKSNEFYARHGFKLVESAEWDNYYVRQPNSEA